jgi:hypothetical protein
MKKLRDLQLNHLLGVFLASMFGSITLSALFNYAVEPGMPLALLPRIALTAAAMVIYAAVAWLTFYLVVPDSRTALLNLVRVRS